MHRVRRFSLLDELGPLENQTGVKHGPSSLPEARVPHFVALRSLVLVWALIGWSVNCSSDESPRDWLISPVASSPTDLSRNPHIALIGHNTACVIVSYEHRVRCVDRSGGLVGVFGKQGEGPGEFRFPRAVVRGPEQTVAVLDPLSSRINFFKPTGELVTVVPVPEVFEPMAPIGETMMGAYMPDFWSSDKMLAEVDLPGGNILWQYELRSPTAIGLPDDCALSWGASTETGVAAFGACNSNLLFYSPGADGQVAVVEAPTYTGELPNRRDIDGFREGRRFLYGGDTVPSAAVQEFAETPKRDRIAGRSLIYDASDRLWVATQRDRDRFSYFDVYADTTFVRSVQVRDRLLGFDMLDGTLVTLVERALDEVDGDGIPDRGIDWYDVSSIR